MSDTKYNGWTNYETWNLALWIDNEQDSHLFWRRQAREHYRQAREDRPRKSKLEAVYHLEKHLEEHTRENAPDLPSFYGDILGVAMGRVNWREIAEHMIDDAAEAAKEK